MINKTIKHNNKEGGQMLKVELLKVVNDKSKHINTRAQALKILALIKIEELKANAKSN